MASVNKLKDRLYLLAKLPPKSGQGPWKPQRIPLYLDDTPVNERTARKRLAELEKQLARGTFEWEYWQPQTDKGITWGKAKELLYRKKVILGTTSESTWDNNYAMRLARVNPTEAVTTESMERFLRGYERESSNYKECFYLLRHISNLTKVPFPEVPTPTYSRAQLKVVPTDEEIVEVISPLSGHEQWHLGMMATYGLRPHEVEFASLDEKDRCDLTKAKKMSGAPEGRIIPPLMEEWVDLFGLREKKERPRRPVTSNRGDLNSQYFYRLKKKLGLSWTAYALRHAYARRLWQEGGAELDIYTAAELMGHAVTEHLRTYRRHIQPHLKSDAAVDAITRNRRRRAETSLSGRQAPAQQRSS